MSVEVSMNPTRGPKPHQATSHPVARPPPAAPSRNLGTPSQGTDAPSSVNPSNALAQTRDSATKAIPSSADDLPSDAPPIYGEEMETPPPPPASNTAAGSAPPTNDLRSDAESNNGGTEQLLVSIPNTTQLIYLRLKARNSKNSYKYADSPILKQVLLPFLAKIPLLRATNLFQSGKLLFSLFKHSSAEKGFFYTASFVINDSQELEGSTLHNIPSLLLQAQQQQAFTLDLPIVFRDKESSKDLTTIPSSVVFALSKEELTTLTTIDFQVKVPPISTRSPALEFAFLLCNIVTPRFDGQSASDYQHFIAADQERFASFCKPQKIITSEHGDFLEEYMQGTFMLSLDDPEARDRFILHRIIFATFFGLDPRFGAHQQFVLSIALLNDTLQLAKKPIIISQLVDSMKLDKRFIELMPSKQRRIRTSRQSPSPQSSDTESEEGFHLRLSKRAEALALLPSAESEFLQEFPSFQSLKYTPTASIIPVLQRIPEKAEENKVTANDLRNSLNGDAARARPQDQQAAAAGFDLRGSLGAPAAQPRQQDQQAAATNFRDCSAASTAISGAHPLWQKQQQQKSLHANNQALLQTQNLRRDNRPQRGQSLAQRGQSRADPNGASHEQQPLAEAPNQLNPPLFTQKMRDTFPSISACSAAKPQATGSDGNCLFHAFLGASKDFKIALRSTTTAADLRNMVIQFLKANRHNKILPAASFVDSEIIPSSPEDMMNMMRPYRLVPHHEMPTVFAPCSCPRPEREHACNGIPAGQLKMRDVEQPLYFKNLDEYLLIMKNNGVYGEDLEIATLSALFSVSICVFLKHPQIVNPHSNKRSDFLDDNIMIYYHPKSKGTVCLVTYSGRCHYEWLLFENDPISTAASTAPPQDNHKETEIIEIPSTPPNITGADDPEPPQPPQDWLDIHIQEFEQNSAEIVFIRDRYDWPPESNPLHSAIFTRIERNLYSPCNPHVQHTCCSRIDGDCSCCTESECSWEHDFDPWAHVKLNPLAYDRMASASLSLVSMDLFSEAKKEPFLLQSFYLFSRMAIFLHNINLQRLFKIKQQSEADLITIRTALDKFIDVLKLTEGYAKRSAFLSKAELANFFTQKTTLDIRYRASLEITDLTITALSMNAKSQSPAASPGDKIVQDGTSAEREDHLQASSQISISDSLKAVDILYKALAADAENSVALAESRLESALPENAAIAALQVKMLSEKLTVAHSKMTADSETLRHKHAHKFSALFGGYAKRIATAQADIANIASSTRDLSRKPLTSATTATPKKKSAQQPPFASPRTDAQQRSITEFLSKVNAKVSFLEQINVGDGIATPAKVPLAESPHSRSASPLNPSLSQEDDEEQLHERMIERRTDAGSTRSIFETEAHNAESNGNDDSFNSKPSQDTAYSSDKDFVASSQEVDEAQSTRALHIKQNIRAATASLCTKPEKKAPQIPEGYCNWGHLIQVSASFSRGKPIKCHACLSVFKQDIFSCRCYRYFACISCLKQGKTAPKPPECPDLLCTGSCVLQHKGVPTSCCKGSHVIPAEENAWFCQAKPCRAVMCVTCYMQERSHRQQIADTAADEISDTLQPSAFEQLRSPHTDTTALQAVRSTHSPNLFLTPTPPRQKVSSSSDQQGQATPMSHNRA
jgi:hypothetical protein